MYVGERVAGRFTIEALAGSGGMSDVYRARDRDGGFVAVKALRGAAPGDRARFEHEAHALAELRHPAVVRYVTHGLTDAGEAYLAMEWLAGEDLGARLARARCSVSEALAVVRAAAGALAELHARGMIHRDLKPSNLFLVDGRIDRLKLIDLGLVRAARPRLTATGALVGTPGYAAPEQAQGATVGPAADVFSLGCVLFEALTGRHAFAGDNLLAVLVKLILDEPPDLGDDCPDASPELAGLLRRMLAKRAEERPADATALLGELAALGPGTATRPARSGTTAPTLTASERRVLSIVLIPASAANVATLGADDEVPAPSPTLLGRLRAAAEAVTGSFVALADGSMLVTIGSMEAATDRAAVAARFALSLRELVADRPIVLATGAAEAGAAGFGDTVERAVRRLLRLRERTHPGPPPIAVDDVTAGLLDARFDCPETATGRELRGERGSTAPTDRAAPFVGRERDLQTLAAALSGVVEESQAHACVIVAPAGAGKSRLCHEFLRRLGDRDAAEVWRAQGDPYRADCSLGLVGDAVRSAMGIAAGARPAERRARLTAAVDAVVAEDQRRHVRELLGELVGAPFPDGDSPQLRAARLDAGHLMDRLQQAVTVYLTACCRRRPVVLVLEDLQWGDHLSVRLLDAVLRDLERPLLIVALARPGVFERFPGLWAARRTQRIGLGPLSRRAVGELIDLTLGTGCSEAVRAAIVDRADGNAFYLEELIRSAARGQHALPGSVVAMAQSRLEGLDPPLRRGLRAASVFGRVFWADGVHALIGAGGQEHATGELLARLVDEELVTRRRSSRFPGEDELEFRHALPREGAYMMLTAEDRRLGHQLAAEWLERRGEPDARVLAEHRDRGGEPARAVEHYVHAAEDSANKGDGAAAIACAVRGLELGATGPARGTLLAIVAQKRLGEGGHAECVSLCEEALGLLAPGGRAWLRVFTPLLTSLVLAAPQRVAERLRLFIATEVADPRLRAEKVHAVLWTSVMLAYAGLPAESRELLAEWRRVLAANPEDVLVRAFVRAVEATHADVVEGDPWRSVALGRESVAGFAAVGLRNYQCQCGAMLGKDLLALGQSAQAEAVGREVLALAETSGDPTALVYARLYLARTLAAGDAPAQWTEAMALARLVADVEPTGQARTVRAELLLRAGDAAGAEAEARAGCGLGWPYAGSWWRVVAVHGRVLLAMDRVAEAVASTGAAVDRLVALGLFGGGDIELLHVAATARRRDGDDAGGRALLLAALERLGSRLAGIPGDAQHRFLAAVDANARLLVDARAWLGDGAPALAGFDLRTRPAC